MKTIRQTKDGWTTDGRRGIGSLWSKTYQRGPEIRASIQYGVGPDRRPFYRLKTNLPGAFERQFHRSLRAAKSTADELFAKYKGQNESR